MSRPASEHRTELGVLARLAPPSPTGIGIDTGIRFKPILTIACENCGAVAAYSLGLGLRALSEQAAAPGSQAIPPFDLRLFGG